MKVFASLLLLLVAIQVVVTAAMEVGSGRSRLTSDLIASASLRLGLSPEDSSGNVLHGGITIGGINDNNKPKETIATKPMSSDPSVVNAATTGSTIVVTGDSAGTTTTTTTTTTNNIASIAAAAAAPPPATPTSTPAPVPVPAASADTNKPKNKIILKPRPKTPKHDDSSSKSAGEMEALFNGPAGTTSSVRRMNLSKIRNSVVQIVCAQSPFNWKRPWQSAAEAEVLGTGFFVRIDDKSYILTNAHVVKEAIKVRVRVPDVGLDNFAADVFGICFEKDIALLRLRDEDTENLQTIRKRAGGQIEHLELGNSDKFAQGSIAVAVGYPLGQANLKFSTGILSGFEHVTERLYLQITAPINPGNSGGPLLNNAGLVMGVNTAAYEKASNVGYAIPVTHIKALLADFVKTGSHFVSPPPSHAHKKKNKYKKKNGSGDHKSNDDNGDDSDNDINDLTKTAAVIHSFPYLGVGLAPATKELCRFLEYDGDGGVFVRKIAPKGICNDAGLKPRDLLLEFDGHPLDRFGKTIRGEPKNGGLAERLTIYDLAERIEIGKTITFTVWRDLKRVELSAEFSHRAAHDYAVPKIVEPVRQDVEYIVIGGVVFMNLALNHIELLVETNPTLINYFRGKHRLLPRVVVSAVLPECTLPEDSVAPGELVTRVNGKDVSSLEDLQQILDKTLRLPEERGHPEKNWLTIDTSENSLVVFDLSKVETRHGKASHKVGKQFNPHRRRRSKRKHHGRHRPGRSIVVRPGH